MFNSRDWFFFVFLFYYDLISFRLIKISIQRLLSIPFQTLMSNEQVRINTEFKVSLIILCDRSSIKLVV